MSPCSRRLILAMLAVVVACERAETPRAAPDSPRHDTAAVAPDSGEGVTDVDWREENGPVLAVAGDSAAIAILVLPALDTPRTSVSDVDTLRDLQVELFGPAGRVGSARLRPRAVASPDDEQCAEWPTAQLVQDPRRRVSRWSVGLAAGSAIAMTMDSLAGMHQPDSSRLAAEIARLASVVPSDTAPMFRGLPFRVHSAYRVLLKSGVTVVVATVVRTINQEANARTEHILIVAEPEGMGSSPRLGLRYFERVSGSEESTETVDVLAALLLGAEQRPTIVLGRSDDSGTAFAFLERSAAGKWTLQWNSPYTDC